MTRKTTTVMLENAQCLGSTARTVETALGEIPGVLRAYVNPATEAAYVEYDADRCTPSDFEDAVRSVGVRTLRPAAAGRHTVAPFTSFSRGLTMHETGTRSRTWWAFAGFVAIAGFFLFTEHRAHLFGVLPFLFLLACPFLHSFGHGGHGNHGGHGDDVGRSTNVQEGDARDRDQAARTVNDEPRFREHQHAPSAMRDDFRIKP